MKPHSFQCLAMLALMLTASLSRAAPETARPWGQNVHEGAEVYRWQPGPRRYNPWAKLRDDKGAEHSSGVEQAPPRYREREKQAFQERQLPQYLDGRGVPVSGFPPPRFGYYPYGWGGMPTPWGSFYHPMGPVPAFSPWGYGGW